MNSNPPATPTSAPVLIGNTFPLSLVRRPVRIEPIPIEELRALLAGGRLVASFWGHVVTVRHASRLVGVDLTPETERPALALDKEKLPSLGGRSFTVCHVLSPEFAPGFRPGIGEEVPAEKIAGWQALRMEWEVNHE